MKVLGISSNYHDASSCLVADGHVVAAAAEERFTLQKHDPSFPTFSSRFCLEQGKIKADDLDLIVYHEDPMMKFIRGVSTSLVRYPFSFPTFYRSMKEAISTGLWIRNEISKKLDVHPRKISFMPHHFSHAAHTFFGSPFKEAAVLTIDAVGEWTSTSLFNGNKNLPKNALELVDMVPFPHSIGLVYSAFTAFLGFKVNDGECSTMALAAFGEPSYAGEVRKILRLIPKGTYEVDVSYFDFSSADRIPVKDKFYQAFGAPRSKNDKLPFDCFLDNQDQATSKDFQRFADIAASIQLVLEETVLHLARRAREITGHSRLCFGGGVALNCVANQKLIEAGIFEEVFVAPDPGDGGGAMGAAMYGAYLLNPESCKNYQLNPYNGKSYSSDQVEDILKLINGKNWHKFSTKNMQPIRSLSKDKFSSESALLDSVATDLKSGKVVGWVQGRFENGPRALGSRSILLSPENVDRAKFLSTQVKSRASFRPYACSVSESESKSIFEGNLQLPHRWMLSSAKVKPALQKSLRAAMHVDGTTRPQIVRFEDHPRYFELLKRMGGEDRPAAVLNTSFNESGLPIASTPLEALAMFARTEMDSLVVGDLVIRKER